MISTLTLSGLSPRAVVVRAEACGSGAFLQVTGRRDDEAAVREASIRVRSALTSIGISVPPGLVVRADTIAPSMDAAIAVAALEALGMVGAGPIGRAFLEGSTIVGELALDGRLRAPRGLYAMLGAGDAIAPDGPELGHAAAALGGLYYGARTLAEIVLHLQGAEPLLPALPIAPRLPDGPEVAAAFAPGVLEQLERAAREGTGVLVIGHGGIAVARALHAMLPPLELDELRTVDVLRSVSGLGGLGSLRRPFRAPHHTVSEAGLLGGGSPARPGEVSLAHGGVLLLDEAPEFRSSWLAALVDIVRHGEVTIASARNRYVMPTRPRCLVASSATPNTLGLDRACRILGAGGLTPLVLSDPVPSRRYPSR